MSTVVVIPAFNEEEIVASVVSDCLQRDLDVCVIDDGSTDATAQRARHAGASVIELPVNIGVGGALRTGFAWAVERGYTTVVQVDGDGQHDPGSIPGLLAAAAETRAPLVVGSRFGLGEYRMSASRRTVVRMLSGLVRRRTGIRIDDVTSGYRVISEPLLSRFAVEYPTEFLSDTVEAILLAHSWNHAIVQVPVVMRSRESGRPTSRLAATGHLLRVLFSIAVKRRA